MTKIDIISGFLGAGKTTLIKKLLSEALSNEKVVLIENEFGEIGIDGGFLKEAGIEIREMNSGCICCSLAGDFGASLKEVIETYHPERILIEPSGVGKLSDVMKAVENLKDRADITLNSYTTVADVNKCKMYLKNFGEFYRNQVEAAGTVILSRTDTAKPGKIEETVELLREINKEAPIITTPVSQLSAGKLLETMEHAVPLEKQLIEEAACEVCGGHHLHGHHHEEDHCCGEGHHHSSHHHADEVFTSWGLETAKLFNKEELKVKLEALNSAGFYGTVLRAKGMVPGDNGEWIYFDMVPGEQEVRSGQPEYTGRICVIGSGLKEEALKELFVCS